MLKCVTTLLAEGIVVNDGTGAHVELIRCLGRGASTCLFGKEVEGVHVRLDGSNFDDAESPPVLILVGIAKWCNAFP